MCCCKTFIYEPRGDHRCSCVQEPSLTEQWKSIQIDKQESQTLVWPGLGNSLCWCKIHCPMMGVEWEVVVGWLIKIPSTSCKLKLQSQDILFFSEPRGWGRGRQNSLSGALFSSEPISLPDLSTLAPTFLYNGSVVSFPYHILSTASPATQLSCLPGSCLSLTLLHAA